MDKLWSPWRSNYIESFKTKKDSDACVFCEALKLPIDSKESLIVYKNKLCYVMLNLYPYNSGHLMVIPNKHVSDIHTLSLDEMNEMMNTVRLSMKALEKAMNPQGIDSHLHFHIVPRWSGDINFMPAIGEVKIISQDLLETKKKLINSFNEILKTDK